MSTSLWGRLSDAGHLASTFLSGLGVVSRARATAAEGLRQVAPHVEHAFAGYFVLLVLVGMVTAGFVVLPVGGVLLLWGVLNDAVDPALLGGLALGVVGLFYLCAPLALIHVVSRYYLRRMQRKVERLADRVEGRR